VSAGGILQVAVEAQMGHEVGVSRGCEQQAGEEHDSLFHDV
jgi:hypothetical protein